MYESFCEDCAFVSTTPIGTGAWAPSPLSHSVNTHGGVHWEERRPPPALLGSDLRESTVHMTIDVEIPPHH
ncbi:hypothetical protein KIN20_003886 [Parelaphostrongylus tenuis]|uniref:Uncharacterized protein n=1 Tax=Parelaphostrongylus tenuis TaxID=148309 RepID=A0AAD5LY04_PARTN|nr:hypothetical protein KIN20_003886 [Parelaphostrongylus tenuis]